MLSSLLLLISTLRAAEPTAIEDARRLSAILDYVAVDYGAAVQDGKKTSEAEYAEQVGFLEDAVVLAARLPKAGTDVTGAVAELAAEVGALAPADQVRQDALALRGQVLDTYGVVLAPSASLSRDQGARLYAEQCAACHGATGGADTATAAQLDPVPRNFRDPQVMAELTPARAYNALTDGVKGTSMAAFGALDARARWDLAYYVFTLRHDAEAEARGSALAAAGRIEAPTVEALAGLGDAALAPGLAGAERQDAIAWIRGAVPYQEARVSLAAARDGLDQALAALRAGDRTEAKRLAGEAYLSGFEPHEASLRQVSPERVARIEEAFLGLRARIDDGASADDLASEVLRTQALLDDAEGALSGAQGARVAFVGAFLVILREGLEAALLVLLLLGFAGKQGGGATRQVHLGWLAAVGVGVLTWMASDRLIALAGARRELLEGLITLLAAAILVTAHHWLVAAADGRRRVEDIRGALGRDLGRWTLTALSFGAVYREAFEVVLFLQAIVLDGASGTGPVLAGMGAGAIGLVVLVAAALRLGRRVRPGPVLTAAGVLLSVLAVVFVGKGLRALQEAGVVPIHALGGLRLDILGIFPTFETTGAQVVLILGLAASALLPRLKARQTSGRPA